MLTKFVKKVMFAVQRNESKNINPKTNVVDVLIYYKVTNKL